MSCATDRTGDFLRCEMTLLDIKKQNRRSMQACAVLNSVNYKTRNESSDSDQLFILFGISLLVLHSSSPRTTRWQVQDSSTASCSVRNSWSDSTCAHMESGGISSDWTGLTHKKVSMVRVFEPNVPPIIFQKRHPRATRCESPHRCSTALSR